MFGPGIAIRASAVSANSSRVDGAGTGRGYRPRRPVSVPRACEASGSVIAKVEPLTTTRRLSGPFDYRVGDGTPIGAILRIPFGHQKLDGVVVALAESSEVEKL